jgi:hypothetical protein
MIRKHVIGLMIIPIIGLAALLFGPLRYLGLPPDDLYSPLILSTVDIGDDSSTRLMQFSNKYCASNGAIQWEKVVEDNSGNFYLDEFSH